MKKLIFYLLINALSIAVYAQSENTILITNEFKKTNPTQKVPFGEKIIIKSEKIDTLIKKLTIKVNYGINTQEVEANITQNGWDAIIGPFDQKQSLIIQFIGKGEPLNNNDWKKIIDSISQLFVENAKGAFKENVSGSEAVILKDAKTRLLSLIPGFLKKYKTLKGETAYDLLGSKIKNLTINPLKDFIHKAGNLTKAKNKFYEQLQEINILINKKDEKLIALANVKELQDIDDKIDLEANWKTIDSVLKIHKITDTAAIKILKVNAEAYIKNNQEASKLVSNEFFKQTELLNETNEFTYTINDQTTLDVSDINRYIGFDMGELFYQRGKASYGTFILISPFLRKTELEDEFTIVNLFKKRDSTNKADFSKKIHSFFDVINPTVGIAIITEPKLDNTTVTWFAGGSMRLNKYVRFVLGDSFYIKDGRFSHHFAIGASINFLRLGDFFKLVGGASSYISKN
jgi:hypothetical protein